MLETISWKEYGLLMGVAINVYYGWWWVKYAPTLGRQRLQGQATKSRMGRLYMEPEGQEPKGLEPKVADNQKDEGAASPTPAADGIAHPKNPTAPSD